MLQVLINGQKYLSETLLMSTHNVCFMEKMRTKSTVFKILHWIHYFFITVNVNTQKQQGKKNHLITLFDLITAHTSISTQSRNFVVFRLQPMYLLSDSL